MTHIVQKLIDDIREKYGIPGLAVSINFPSDLNQQDYVSGSTTLHGTTPLNSDHLFQIGSITKTFTATLLLQLEAEEILSIDDYINNWVPISPGWENITIKQLLNHTSGIYNYTDSFDEIMKVDQNIDFYKQWETDELINIAKLKPPYFHPGLGWHYSNTNYAIAALIIEAATNNSISKEMETRFFSMLNMRNTYYLPQNINPQILNCTAHGYSKRKYFPEEPKDITTYNLSWACAAGGILSTAHDIAIWLRSLMNGSLLPTKQMNSLITTVPTKEKLSVSTNQEAYGLGIQYGFTSAGEWFGHSGGTLGYSALACWHKAINIIIAITANHISTNRDVYLINEELIQHLYGFIQ